MNYFIERRANMTESEWAMYEQHLAKRAREEEQKIEAQRLRNRKLKEYEIERILRISDGRWTREELEKSH